jgi:hypothetical protein
MNWKRRFQGSALAIIGFLLSPLSWWNDLFINVPLAVGFAWIVSLFYRPAFQVAVVIGYWLTNVLGFVLMHKGARKVISKEEPPPYSKREFARDVGVSLLYTLLIVVLVKLGVLQPLTDYWKPK